MLETFTQGGGATATPQDSQTREGAQTQEQQEAPVMHDAVGQPPKDHMVENDLSQHYWWCGMKRDISDFVSRCLTCQQVKCEHQRPGGVSQRMPIPTWKWERITMDFVVMPSRSEK